MQFILRWVITSLAISFAVWIVPGVTTTMGTTTWIGVLTVGLFLTLINMSVKPIFQVLALPLTVLTMGIFYLVVNAIMLELATWLAYAIFQQGLVINGFFAAFLAAIIVSVATMFLNAITGNAAND